MREHRRDFVERIQRATVEPHDVVVVRGDERRDVVLAVALGRLTQTAQRLAQGAADAVAREVVAHTTRIGHEPAEMLPLAHDLEAEPLGGRCGRVRRRLHDGGSAVIVEQLGDRDHALLFRLLLLHRVERGGETGELGTRGIERATDAHGGRDAAQHRRGGTEHGEALGADLRLAALERMRRVFRGLQDVGERGVILHAGDAAHGAYAPQHVGGGVAVGRTSGEQFGAGTDVRDFRREEAAVGRRGPAARCRRRGAIGGIARQLVDPRARARVVGRTPGADVPQKQLAVVHRGDERAGERRLPAGRPPSQSATDTLDAGRHLGERGQLGHRRAAAKGTSDALERFGVGRSGVGREQQRIELLDVLAGFENEEVEKACRGRHSGSDLVCKSGRLTKLGPAAGGVHRRAQLAHGGVEADEDRTRDHVMSDVELLDLGDRGHGSDVFGGEAMSGMNRQMKRRAERCCVTKRVERGAASGGVCVAPRVQLDGVRSEIA